MPGENQDVPRSGARPAAPQLAHNSVRAASATSWRPTPPAPTGRPQKLLYSFFSSVASSDDDPACRNSNLDSGKTRCVACRYSQTPPLTFELPTRVRRLGADNLSSTVIELLQHETFLRQQM